MTLWDDFTNAINAVIDFFKDTFTSILQSITGASSIDEKVLSLSPTFWSATAGEVLLQKLNEWVNAHPEDASQIATILSALNPISQSIFFICFILEEALQTLSMGIWQAKRAYRYDTARKLLTAAATVQDTAERFLNTIGAYAPHAQLAFGEYFFASRSQLDAWDAIIKHYDDPDIKAQIDEVEDWYADEKVNISIAEKKELRQAMLERRRKLDDLKDRLKAGDIDQSQYDNEEWAIYEEYYNKRADINKKYDKQLRALRISYKHKIAGIDQGVSTQPPTPPPTPTLGIQVFAPASEAKFLVGQGTDPIEKAEDRTSTMTARQGENIYFWYKIPVSTDPNARWYHRLDDGDKVYSGTGIGGGDPVETWDLYWNNVFSPGTHKYEILIEDQVIVVYTFKIE